MNKPKLKTEIKLQDIKTEYPELTFEEIQQIVKEFNEAQRKKQ